MLLPAPRGGVAKQGGPPAARSDLCCGCCCISSSSVLEPTRRCCCSVCFLLKVVHQFLGDTGSNSWLTSRLSHGGPSSGRRNRLLLTPALLVPAKPPFGPQNGDRKFQVVPAHPSLARPRPPSSRPVTRPLSSRPPLSTSSFRATWGTQVQHRLAVCRLFSPSAAAKAAASALVQAGRGLAQASAAVFLATSSWSRAKDAARGSC